MYHNQEPIFKTLFMKPTGKIQLILSMMRGGKTSELIHILETVGYAVRALYINHKLDTRSDKAFSTHNVTLDVGFLSEKLNADMIKVQNLSEIPDDIIKKYPVVCIDESQFYSDLPEVVTRWAEEFGIDIYVAGLSGDYRRKNFGRIHELLPLADNIKFLRDTLCSRCALSGKRVPALFTYRIDDSSGKQVEIGNENYLSICRNCYRGFYTKKE